MIGRAFGKIIALLTMAIWLPASAGQAAVAPVAQLPTVTAGATPSPYILPILLLSDQNEWKDFGIQVNLKVYASSEEQADRIAGNEWEVGVLDPFWAIKGGNEGDVAIIGVAGNLPKQLYLLASKGKAVPPSPEARQFLQGKEILPRGPSAEDFLLSLIFEKPRGAISPTGARAGADPVDTFLKGKGEFALLRSPGALLARQQGFEIWADLQKQEAFLPVCLVASTLYADTRKTLVIRWLEGYSRGIRILMKNPAQAASRLKDFYRETLKIEVPLQLLEMEVAEAFFSEKKQEEAFKKTGNEASPIERFAQAMSEYQVRTKILKTKKDPGEYIQDKMCEQLASLRREAETQFKQTRMTIDQAEKEGMKVEKFRLQLDEARGQMEEGRGCLTVIGTLSNLMRSAEQAKVEAQRFKKFRLLEFGFGGGFAVYYAGYFARRRKRKKDTT